MGKAQTGAANQLSIDYFVREVEQRLSLEFEDNPYSIDCKSFVLSDIIANRIDSLGSKYLLQIAFANPFLAEEVYDSSFITPTTTPIDLIKDNLKEDIRIQVLEGQTYNNLRGYRGGY